jgi:hypothetical protein
VNATDADRAAVEAAARKLERLNPNPRSLSAAAINGRWELIYTTSVSILGSNRPFFLRPQGAWIARRVRRARGLRAQGLACLATVGCAVAAAWRPCRRR